MRNCPACRASIDDGPARCPRCGRLLESAETNNETSEQTELAEDIQELRALLDVYGQWRYQSSNRAPSSEGPHKRLDLARRIIAMAREELRKHRAAEQVVDRRDSPTEEVFHSILELQGLGKEIWQGLDAQDYVDRERASWGG